MKKRPTRRDFLETGLKAGTAVSLGLVAGGVPGDLAAADSAGERSGHNPADEPRAPRASRGRSLRILILGGTGVAGPHWVAQALDRGHTVTVFNRGQTQPLVNGHLFDQVEQLVGDRASDLSALDGRTWDVVVDNSGYDHEWVERSAELLRDSVDLYLFTSSTGVYYPYMGYDTNEESPILDETPGEATDAERGSYDYGTMKARSEAAVRRIFGEERTVVLRPSYIVGPGDNTYRFTYWPLRIAQGGEVLVPGHANDPIQYIDSRDLTAFGLHLLEQGTTGTYNVVGPASPLGMHAFVHGVHAAFSSSVEWVYVDDQPFLLEHGVQYVIPWIMPYDKYWGALRVSNQKAMDAGLTFRPLAESSRNVYEWWMSDAVSEERRARMAEGLMAREADVIAAWRAR